MRKSELAAENRELRCLWSETEDHVIHLQIELDGLKEELKKLKEEVEEHVEYHPSTCPIYPHYLCLRCHPYTYYYNYGCNPYFNTVVTIS